MASNPYLAMLMSALSALRGSSQGMPPGGVGGQGRPLDPGAGPMGQPNPMDKPAAGPGSQPMGAPQQAGAPPMGGADLAALAKLITQNQGGGGPEMGKPASGPYGGGGGTAQLKNPVPNAVPPQMAPPAAPTPAPMAQGPMSIGALLASPQGQALLQRLRAMQSGQMMTPSM